LAYNHGLRSVAFPVIGSGSTGFPFLLASTIALEEARHALSAYAALEKVVFAFPDERTFDLTNIYCDLFGEPQW
jgi:O-acetyl-ADP-ribose deacetylase (regulator of RNase III)